MKRLEQTTIDEINKYLGLNINSLYSALEAIQLSQERTLYRPSEQIKKGIEIFKSIEPILRKKICDEWDYCKKQYNPECQDTINLIATISDIICTQSIGFPPILIATILVKKGLNSFCNCSNLKIEIIN